MRVVILRGISGSGKTTRVDALQKEAESAGFTSFGVVSADHFFEAKPDGYTFNPSELGEAHAECMNDFLDMLKSRTQFVVVDNTNTRIWEFKNYAAIAETLGYQVVVVDMHGNPRAMSLERIHILAQRCVHGLTTAQIVAQALRWEKYGR